MNLYLVRHADAVPLGAGEVPGEVLTDEERPLSEAGKRQVEGLAALFRRLAIVPDRLLTSPLVRASQTAEGLRGNLQLPADRLTECRPLAPGGSTRKLAKALGKLALANVVVVGHEPDLGQHTAWLLGSKRARISFAKGGVACVVCDRDVDKGTGVLRWLITPQLFDEAKS